MADSSALHRDALVIDAHNDSIVSHIRRGNLSFSGGPAQARHDGTIAYLRGPFGRETMCRELQVNFPKMRAGGIDAAFFAVDVTRAWKNHLAYALDGLGYFEVECRDAAVNIALSAQDIRTAKDAGQLAAVLVVENSDCIEGSLNVLYMLYRLGVRSIGLTHSNNSMAAPGIDEARGKAGLTTFGVALVKEMNRLGMLVDVSHISEPGFRDVLEISEYPVIASHSNCRAVCDHPRNLTDEQIRDLARHGGTMGITFVPHFIDAKMPTFGKLLDHIDHAVGIAGIDHVGLGSDFDGGGWFLNDATHFPSITEGLLQRGYPEDDIRKILGENHLRVLSASLNG